MSAPGQASTSLAVSSGGASTAGSQQQGCPHWRSLIGRALTVELLQKRFRDPLFQKTLVGGAGECLSCKSRFTLENMWACLECEGVDAVRCGRNANKHSGAHYQSTKHTVVVNLKSRVVWCYACDNEVSDFENPGGKGTITPNDVREAFNTSDSASTEEAELEDGQEVKSHGYLDYLNNQHGGTVGLSNLGNTCYLNSTLQGLLHCQPLVAFFSELDPRIANETARQRLVHDFSALMQKTWGGRYSVCQPRDVVQDIWHVAPQFRGYQQHDSQDFLRAIVDNMHDGMKLLYEYEYNPAAAKLEAEEKAEQAKEEASRLKAERKIAAGESKTDGKAEEKSPKTEEKKSVPRETSIVQDIFGGVLLSSVKCSNCGSISHKEDPFWDLSVEIPKDQQLSRVKQERGSTAMTSTGKQSWFSNAMQYIGVSSAPLSLETCLHSFCTSDQLIKRDQYRCDKCKLKVDASKLLAIKTLPEVLTVHIKRFSHNSYFGNKLSRHIIFPANNLDMAPFLVKSKVKRPENANTLYDLFAIVRHIGAYGSGHYISYAKQHVTGKWYCFDDRDVTEVTESEVRKQEAYLLFYRRKPDAKRISKVVEDIKNAEADDGKGRCFISRHWVKKAVTMSQPDAIDNRDLCCQHGVPFAFPASGNGRAMAISLTAWEQLVATYGGGPFIGTEKQQCAVCLLPLIRDAERKRISELDAEAQRLSNKSDPFYIIHDEWLVHWRRFVTQDGPRPGPITNQALLNEDGAVKEGLERVRDYRGLHVTVWNALHKIYGGGPVIVRASLNIYDREPGSAGSGGGRESPDSEDGGQGQGQQQNGTSQSQPAGSSPQTPQRSAAAAYAATAAGGGGQAGAAQQGAASPGTPASGGGGSEPSTPATASRVQLQFAPGSPEALAAAAAAGGGGAR